MADDFGWAGSTGVLRVGTVLSAGVRSGTALPATALTCTALTGGGSGATGADATETVSAGADATGADVTETGPLDSLVSSVVSATTGVPVVATASAGVGAGRSARMLPSQAIKLAKANPNTKEITREVESVAWSGGVLAGPDVVVAVGSPWTVIGSGGKSYKGSLGGTDCDPAILIHIASGSAAVSNCTLPVIAGATIAHVVEPWRQHIVVPSVAW